MRNRYSIERTKAAESVLCGASGRNVFVVGVVGLSLEKHFNERL